MKLLYKSIYKPRFHCYGFITGLILIVDGIITIFVHPFGYSSGLYTSYCEWNIKKDIARSKLKRIG